MDVRVSKSIFLGNAATYSKPQSAYFTAANPQTNTTVISGFVYNLIYTYTFQECLVGDIVALYSPNEVGVLYGLGEYVTGPSVVYFFVEFDLQDLTCKSTQFEKMGRITTSSFSPKDNILFILNGIFGKLCCKIDTEFFFVFLQQITEVHN